MDNAFLNSLKVDIKPLSAVQEFLQIAEILKKEGIDISKVKQKIGSRNEQRWTVLSDAWPDGFDLRQICTKYPNLKLDYPIGRKINEMSKILNGNSKGYKISDEEMAKLQKLFERKKSANKELLEVLRIISPDFTTKAESIKDLVLRTNGKAITLGQLYYDSFISSPTRDLLKQMGYEHDFPLGQRIIRARRLVDGKIKDNSLSNEEKEELKSYIGISRKYSIEKIGDEYGI